MLRALLAGGRAAAEFLSISVATQFKLDARHRSARRDMFVAVWQEGVERAAAQAAFEEEAAQALREAEREIDAARCAILQTAQNALDAAVLKLRDAMDAADASRQGRSLGGGQEKQVLLGSGSDDRVPVVCVVSSPPMLAPGGGERGASGSRGSGLKAVRRGREMAGRVPRRAVC